MRASGSACLIALVLLSAPLLAPAASEPSTGFDGTDAVVQELAVRREDQEECKGNADCDDWCKEQDATACVCRCGDWVPRADMGCEQQKRYCQRQPPHFWGGSFNATAKSLKKRCKKHSAMLIAVTARSCGHCLDFEPSYRWAAPAMDKVGVPLARVDADREKDFSDEHGVTTLPVVRVMYKCKDKGLYKGVQSPAAMEEYARKLVAPALRELTTVQEVEAFSEAHNVSVVGFFGGGGGEDEEEEFAEAAETLRFAHNVHVAAVRAKAVVAHFIDARWVKRAPSVVVTRNFDKGEKDRDAVLMTELPDESVERWISKRTVRLVDEVTGQNFAYYESLRLPMLLLFVNKTVDNSAILKLYKQAAKDYQGQISFVSIDGVLFASRKLALGLVDDVLPAMAMNTLDGALYPYPTHQRIDLQGVSSFARDFLGGRLKASHPTASAAEVKAAEDDAASKGAEGLVEVTRATFDSQVMDATHDVVVLFYSAPAKATQDMWPYWKKTVERFRLLGADTLRVARYDVSRNQLPESIELESIPGIIIFPAKDKEPPYKMYHGKAKVRPIMYWVQQMASVPIEFPNDTPHLDAEQREAYIVQIAERDERVGLKRATEKAERIARLSKEAGVHAAGENEAKAGGGHTEL